MATDINAQAGKGSRRHRNVSTAAYRDGWDYIFARCPAHPEYRGIKPPKCYCERCLEVYKRQHPKFVLAEQFALNLAAADRAACE